MEALEPIALGELNLTPEQFGSYTLKEIDALYDGYLRRQDRLEDMFILYCALPTYRGAYGKKAPTYRALTKHRQQHGKVARIDEASETYWKSVLKEVEVRIREAQPARTESQNNPAPAQHAGEG